MSSRSIAGQRSVERWFVNLPNIGTRRVYLPELEKFVAFAAAPIDKVGPHWKSGKKDYKIMHLYLYEKDPDGWIFVEDGAWGKMKYNTGGSELNFVFNGHGLEPDEDYSLIYYPEPQDTWPWPVTVLAIGVADTDGNVHLAGSWNPDEVLDNVKIWLVLDDDIVGGSISGWTPEEYLFEHNLIDFDDTDI